jgi:hypothetical protein
MVAEGANIDMIYDVVVALAADTNDYTVNIFLNAVINICKIYPHLIVRTTQILSAGILILYGKSYMDPVIAGSILDLIVLIIDNSEAGGMFLEVFIPNMMIVVKELACDRLNSPMELSFAQEESRISFLTTLIDILVLSLRKSEVNKFDLNLLYEPFDLIVDIILLSTNPISVVKATVCLKSYFLYSYIILRGKNLMSKVFSVLDRLLQPREMEILSQYSGNLVMVITDRIQNDNRDASMELMKRLLIKLSKSSLPTTI